METPKKKKKKKKKEDISVQSQHLSLQNDVIDDVLVSYC